jgi:chromosome segregation ATPase
MERDPEVILTLLAQPLDSDSILTTFDKMIANFRASEKERAVLARKCAMLEAQEVRHTKEVTRVQQEYEKLYAQMVDKNERMKILREEVNNTTGYLERISILETDLSNERDANSKLQNQVGILENQVGLLQNNAQAHASELIDANYKAKESRVLKMSVSGGGNNV